MAELSRSQKEQSKKMVECRLKMGFGSAKDFYEAHGKSGKLFSYPQYQKYESGERPLTRKAAILYAGIYNVDWEWLLGTKDKSDLAAIDVVDAVASCGAGIENFNPVVTGKQLISVRSLKEITNSRPENIKIIKIRGDSMQPTINDSDVVWVDISYKQPRSDGIYVFCIGGELIVKRLRFDFIRNSATIVSDNPAYPPIDTENTKDIHCIGRIIAINKMLG